MLQLHITYFEIVKIHKHHKRLKRERKLKIKTYFDLVDKFLLVGKMTSNGIGEGWLNHWSAWNNSY